MLEVKMHWTGGLKFEGDSVFGHRIVTDGGRQAGGSEAGFKPPELLLFGIAGCTGIDVVRQLEKQRQKLGSLEIQVTAHQNEDYPRPYHTFEIKYCFKGDNLSANMLARAIELSESKYCMVSQTMQSEAKVTSSFEIAEE
ncbi:MAG: OsmC family protein [candidate division Zixibacteria bacterium]|nr:OsmC family protein [candidate division Zixibacteria bacterium]MDH3937660.1 OsmC family protein [candidate division Zixibacteria bacterium]MDH4034218.1 OsmC family protein [candidate division Zixibacteria bacterium]